jgi:hypothetical protein
MGPRAGLDASENRNISFACQESKPLFFGLSARGLGMGHLSEEIYVRYFKKPDRE